MTDGELVTFLQWALPRLGLRWAGYRKVRRQVRKRIARRISALGLESLQGYRQRLEQTDAAGEWRALDRMCRISISRVMRDREVFRALQSRFLPALARQVRVRDDRCIAAWSAGCASGEEPYSLAILWRLGALSDSLQVDLSIVASDVDERMMARARRAIYPSGCLKEVPPAWREAAFELQPDGALRLKAAFRKMVTLLDPQDLRERMPAGPFDLVLCRNLTFTYFTERLQRAVLANVAGRLRANGLLVIGGHERLPELPSGIGAFTQQGQLPIFQFELS